jgi:pimeloyl-ACP methyl ester carboxylesterase
MEAIVSEFVGWDSQPLDQWAERFAEGRIIDLGGRSTHYVQKGHGPPVILIHGFNYDLNTWMSNIDALAEHFKVYAVDLWGAGYSTREELDYGFALFSEQIRLFMQELGIARAHLVGHSMGGGTSIFLSVNHPELVDRVVLVGSVGVARPLPLRGRLFMLPRLPELLMGLGTDRIRRKNLADYWIHDPEMLSDEVFERMSRYQKIEGTTRASLDILRRNFFHTLDEEIHTLSGLDIPVLMVWGRHDRSVPLESGETMHRIIDGSRLEVLDGAAHLVNFDQAERFNRIVIDFLGGA